ncbi:MAG TPA: hypothetical protein VFW40_14155 [Capsulimonadaceae bacterium]|nr:hypothetical protein [Capsulimonadaceae bacterium]
MPKATKPIAASLVLDEERVPHGHRDLFGPRSETPYTEAERVYSEAVQAALEDLLAGSRQQIVLLRRFYDGPARIGVMPAPAGVDRGELRLATVEEILMRTLLFMRDVSPGGPVFQREAEGFLIETQQFSTKYPHIVIERVDAFHKEGRSPEFTEWRLRRTQNQKAETQINRWLDIANLGLSVLKSISGEP